MNIIIRERSERAENVALNMGWHIFVWDLVQSINFCHPIYLSGCTASATTMSTVYSKSKQILSMILCTFPSGSKLRQYSLYLSAACLIQLGNNQNILSNRATSWYTLSEARCNQQTLHFPRLALLSHLGRWFCRLSQWPWSGTWSTCLPGLFILFNKYHAMAPLAPLAQPCGQHFELSLLGPMFSVPTTCSDIVAGAWEPNAGASCWPPPLPSRSLLLLKIRRFKGPKLFQLVWNALPIESMVGQDFDLLALTSVDSDSLLKMLGLSQL